ncbi:MAG: sulfurtransferase [Gammaproteobacteria bacterium]|nr:MAG: sulfurtransferase [Gammaproteobacteria bacterium]
MQHMTATELAEWLARNPQQPQLLDVREPWEFELCHIDGSRLLPLGQLPTGLDALALDPEVPVVVICHHGIRSRHACRLLEHAGFSRVINLSGGVEAWAEQVDPSMPRY